MLALCIASSDEIKSPASAVAQSVFESRSSAVIIAISLPHAEFESRMSSSPLPPPRDSLPSSLPSLLPLPFSLLAPPSAPLPHPVPPSLDHPTLILPDPPGPLFV